MMRMVRSVPLAPASKPVMTASITASSESPARCATWRKPDLGVDDAVGGEILGAFTGDPFDRRGGLHHAHGVSERLQVQGEVLAVGALQHPCGEFVGIGSGEIGIAGFVGKLDDRRGSQPTVEMVVEQDLGARRMRSSVGGPTSGPFRGFPYPRLSPGVGSRNVDAARSPRRRPGLRHGRVDLLHLRDRVLASPIIDDLGISRTQVGLIGSVNTGLGALSAPLSGRLTDRIGHGVRS